MRRAGRSAVMDRSAERGEDEGRGQVGVGVAEIDVDAPANEPALSSAVLRRIPGAENGAIVDEDRGGPTGGEPCVVAAAVAVDPQIADAERETIVDHDVGRAHHRRTRNAMRTG